MYILYGILVLCVLLLFYMLVIEPRRLKKKHYFIRKNKLHVLDISNAYDLYRGKTNITVAHISDTHFSRSYHPRRMNAIIRSVLQQSPDIIVFTGDLVDNYKNWPHRYTKKLIEKLTKLPAPMGKFAVLGNHDYKENGEYFIAEVFKESDFILLKNQQHFSTNEKISIAISGTDDALHGEPIYQFARTAADWQLLLIHEPDSVQNIELPEAYDLILAGHSHGGQVRLPFVHFKHPGAIHYTRGLYLLTEKTLLSVNQGLGTTVLPIRFGAPPEIIYYHLAKDEPE